MVARGSLHASRAVPDQRHFFGTGTSLSNFCKNPSGSLQHFTHAHLLPQWYSGEPSPPIHTPISVPSHLRNMGHEVISAAGGAACRPCHTFQQCQLDVRRSRQPSCAGALWSLLSPAAAMATPCGCCSGISSLTASPNSAASSRCALHISLTPPQSGALVRCKPQLRRTVVCLALALGLRLQALDSVPVAYVPQCAPHSRRALP